MVKSNTEDCGTRAVTDEEHDIAERVAYEILALFNARRVEPVAGVAALAIAGVQFCINTSDPADALRDLQSVQNQYMSAMRKSIDAGATTRTFPGKPNRNH